MPVLRPLIGMDKEEITAAAVRLGTYETSIIPDEDCCSLFTPRFPATRASLDAVEAAERELDVNGLVDGRPRGRRRGGVQFSDGKISDFID